MKGTVIGTAAVFATAAAWALPADDIKAVSALDTRYQAAVKANDAGTMANILDPDFVLVIGNGSVFDTKELLRSARDKDAIYTHQEEEPGTQTVRAWGDTAVVTAKLWLAGTRGGNGPQPRSASVHADGR